MTAPYRRCSRGPAAWPRVLALAACIAPAQVSAQAQRLRPQEQKVPVVRGRSMGWYPAGAAGQATGKQQDRHEKGVGPEKVVRSESSGQTTERDAGDEARVAHAALVADMAPAALAAGQKTAVRRGTRPGLQLELVMPDVRARRRLELGQVRAVDIVSWAMQHTLVGDPWAITLTGFNDREQVVVEMQAPSKVIGMVPPWREGLAASVRRAIRDAVQFTPFHSFERIKNERVGMDSLGPLGQDSRAEISVGTALPIHAPVRVSAVDRSGDRAQTVYRNVVNVRGLPFDGTNGGRFQTHYELRVQPANLFVTPAYQVPGQQSAQADLLGLAALPAGSRVTVTNLDMDGRPALKQGATVAGVVKRRSSSVHLTLPAPVLGCRYQLTVEFPGQPDASNTVTSTWYFSLPDPDGPQVKAGKISYYGISLQDSR